MNFLENDCTFYVLDKQTLASCNRFCCDHDDLDDFFNNASFLYSDELLGKSYCFRLNHNPEKIVGAFTVSNSSIRISDLPSSRKTKIKSKIPYEKHTNSFPAVLIGRLGVNSEFKGQKIGSALMDFIKAWFIDPHNKTGCRFIVVDAYNEEVALSYYEKNGFQYMFSQEKQEAECTHKDVNIKLNTRLMYFDLILLKAED